MSAKYGRLEGARVYRGAPRVKEPRFARDAIIAALSFRGLANDIRAESLLSDWTELVGARIAARTRPDGIYDRTLVIEVVSSAWLQELNMLRAQILAGLLERVGQPRLFDELRFKIEGRTRRHETQRPRGRPPAPVRAFTMPAIGLAREQIVREASAVDDEELRELIAKVRIANDK
jgi:predicted nucleic acid-binding Zn ribbon protein